MSKKPSDSAPRGGIVHHTIKRHFGDLPISDGQLVLMLAGLVAFATGVNETATSHHLAPMVLGGLVCLFGFTASLVRAYWCATHDGR